MRVLPCPSPTEASPKPEPKTLSFEEIKEFEGVYQRVDNRGLSKSFYLIVVRALMSRDDVSVLYYDEVTHRLETAVSAHREKDRRYVKVNKNIHFHLSDKS